MSLPRFPMKLHGTTRGAIVDVEEGEAEALLEVLQHLFDFYYVAPSKAAALRSRINQRLKDTGKPPLKKP